MKPTKKKPANRAVRTGSVEHKLLQLSNRIDKVAMGDVDAEHKADKHWVSNLITDVRAQGWNKLCREDMLKCNSLWRQYEG